MFRSYPNTGTEINLQRDFNFLSNRSLPFLVDEIDLATKMLENERAGGIIANGTVENNLIRLEVPNQLVIIGDLHGDIGSLTSILKKVSFRKFLSNSENKMIFLGDYVDRGSDSAGVLQTVCYLKRKYPDSVLLLCGNHEAVERFPFSAHNLPQELYAKYGPKGRFVYEKLLRFFRALPKFVIVEGCLLITHGGIPVSIPQDTFFENISGDDDGIVEELLWNDPRSDIPGNQDWCESRRGFGKHFGKNISKRGLALTHTKALIRGHEPCYGFKIDHDNLVLTLFSSKEAYQKFDAAYLFITKKELLEVKNAAELANYVEKIGG